MRKHISEILKPFESHDYDGFAGVAGDNPKIGELTIDEKQSIIVIDSICICVYIGEEDTTYFFDMGKYNMSQGDAEGMLEWMPIDDLTVFDFKQKGFLKA